MRGTDLQGKPVVTESGERLGRVFEIVTVAGEVTALVVGRGGWRRRFWNAPGGRRVAWARVRRIEADRIAVAD
jgi:sporulation protein YlmC with PRC-barrel domain